ncbi:MAG: putative immunity protein [Chloroflexota bacterium]
MLYKVLNNDCSAYHGGSGVWHLPKGKRPGKWMPAIVNLILCERGYHLCRREDLIHWLGPTVWVAEGRGEKLLDHDKVVFTQARLLRRLDTWTERTARLFAADCAEAVLPLFEKDCPNDNRPRSAVEAARKFTRGKISEKELYAACVAARDAACGDATYAAAWAAARDAARAAARDAAWAAAYAAARAAAWAAARDAAWAAAYAAAYAATRDAQTNLLFEHLEGKRQ